MQNVINTVKGKALEVAEYLTPVLKGFLAFQTWRVGSTLSASPFLPVIALPGWVRRVERWSITKT
ncbi:Ubiquitin-like-conjugating enzyme ATG3 [Fukomys damarensis]|uniref:Ubiquitin-like-conjugating enzyme ATG3 n=1 Tax=Fukomys damarensis TaxID=885580 RepID=A0A091DF65_FUKDA|nr:Ubiquitin-like-conjugating enzyme ATG3 [Fukomys damarensis]